MPFHRAPREEFNSQCGWHSRRSLFLSPFFSEFSDGLPIIVFNEHRGEVSAKHESFKPDRCCPAFWAIASAISGVLMQNLTFSAPLIAGGSIKIGYDVLLYRKFRHIRPPEEFQ